MKKIIDLIATGSGKKPEQLEKAMVLIENIGFIPRAPKTIFGDHPLYANTDENRLKNLVEALYAEDSEIIWCLGGGSGTTRLLPHLNKLAPPTSQKMVIGLSDVTALLLFLSQKWGWQVVHGPPAGYTALKKFTPEAIDTIVQLIQGKTKVLGFKNLVPLNPLAQKHQVIEGLITGGNMSLIEYSVGAPWQIETQDCILFFEDINEEAYRIAERLEHLRQAGIFKGVKAILFGDLSHTEIEKNKPDLVEFVLKDFAEDIEIPCFSNLHVGHNELCFPLIINLKAKLTTGLEGELKQYIEERKSSHTIYTK